MLDKDKDEDRVFKRLLQINLEHGVDELTVVRALAKVRDLKIQLHYPELELNVVDVPEFVFGDNGIVHPELEINSEPDGFGEPYEELTDDEYNIVFNVVFSALYDVVNAMLRSQRIVNVDPEVGEYDDYIPTDEQVA